MAIRGFSYLGATVDLSYVCNDASYSAYPTEIAITKTSGSTPIYLLSEVLGSPLELVVGREEVVILSASAAEATAPFRFLMSAKSRASLREPAL